MTSADKACHKGENSDRVDNRITGGVFFQAVVQGRDITVQLPPQITPALSGLPAPAAVFVECGGHIASLLKRLAPDTRESFTRGMSPAPVTAVSGLAGVGKTELAVQTAVRALKKPGWFPGGVLFIDMFGYDPKHRLSPERALDGLLRALGIPGEHIPGDRQDRQRLYRSVLAAYAEQGQRILVVIDNASSVEQARPLLPTDGTTAALVTSRHTLDGLDARLHDVDILDQPASVSLLDLALRHARGDDDTRITAHPESAATIARLCAGLPLALRIAAASLAAMPTRPAADLAIALESEHTRLERLRRPDRALRAAFDLSYRLLDSCQARLFRLLPLNPGPDISTVAATHLAGAAPDQVSDLLQHLTDAHLIEPGTAWGRWRMHDLIRIYADNFGLRHAGEDLREQAKLRLINYYDHATKAAVDRLEAGIFSPIHFSDRDEALEWLETERANLTGIVAIAANGHREGTAVSLAADLGSFFHRCRYLDDWIAVTTTALEASRRIDDRDGEGRLLSNLGSAFKEKRLFKESIEHLEAAATRFHEMGDINSEGAVLCNLGATLVDARKFEEAVEVLKSSMAKLRTSSPQNQTVLLTTLGLALTSTHRHKEAISFLAAAVPMAQQTGDRKREGISLLGLGEAWAKLGQTEDAVNALTVARGIFQQLGELQREGSTLSILGQTLGQAGRMDEALDTLADAFSILRHVDDRPLEGKTFSIYASTLRKARRFKEAIDAQRESILAFREIGNFYREGLALAESAEILQDLHKFEEALEAHKAAAVIFHTSGDIHEEALAQCGIGISLVELKLFDEAIPALTPAITALREIGDVTCEGIALANRGLSLRSVGRFNEAVIDLAGAVSIFQDIGDQQREYMAAVNLSAALSEEKAR